MAPVDHPCDVSPFCRPASAVLADIGLPSGLPYRWVHLGPIEPRHLPVAEHRCEARLASRRVEPSNGLGRFGGYQLDVFGSGTRPSGVAARFRPEVGLWVVYAVVHRVAEGLGVEWRAGRSGIGTFVPVGLLDEPVADVGAILGRCFDLFLGRGLGAVASRKTGRPRGPSAEVQAQHDERAAEAEALKAAGQSIELIARNMGIDPRTLYTWRRDWRSRQQSAEAAPSVDLRRSS